MSSPELTMVDVRELLRRFQAGEAVRRSARECGADRKTPCWSISQEPARPYCRTALYRSVRPAKDAFTGPDRPGKLGLG